ncbi:MAG: polysaccharide deacetylase family protein [Myxococcota bacterium]
MASGQQAIRIGVLAAWAAGCPRPGALPQLERAREGLGRPSSVEVGFQGTLTYAGHFPVPDQTEDWTVEGRSRFAGSAVRSTWQVAEVDWTEVLDGDTPLERIEALMPWPALLLDDLLAQPANLRAVDRHTVLWGSPEGLFELTLAHGRPVRLERRYAHPVFGDTADVATWSDYEDVGGTTLPATWTLERAQDDARWWLSATLTDVVSPASEPPLPEVFDTVPLGDDAWAVAIPAADARSLVVRRGEEGLVFDPPLSSALGETLWRTARELAPEVTQWAVVVSHHHPHYTGGLRPFARDGVPVVVSPLLVPWVTALLQAPRDLDPADPPIPSPVVRTDTRLAGVRIVEIGAASEHTDSYRVAALPEHGLLYAADLVSFPLDGPPRRRQAMDGVAALPEAEGLTEAFSAWPLAGSAPTGPLQAPELRVALTFDDLPSQTVARGQPSVTDPQAQLRISEAMIAALAAHQVPAAVFVNCGLLGEADVLGLWREAGATIGNHTHTHASAEQVPLEVWGEEVRACHQLLTERTGAPPRWFRYPYLRRGDASTRDATAAVLADLGERPVPVTAATSEWRLAQLYDEAAQTERPALVEALVEHMVASLRAAAWQVRVRHGVSVPHIALMHVNALNAEALDAVLTRFEAEGFTFVDLETAMADPYYARPDVQDQRRSLPWQLRIDPPLAPGEPQWFDQAEARIEERFGGGQAPR